MANWLWMLKVVRKAAVPATGRMRSRHGCFFAATFVRTGSVQLHHSAMNSSMNVLRMLARRGAFSDAWILRKELGSPIFTRLYHPLRAALPRRPQLAILSQRLLERQARCKSTATPPAAPSPQTSTETTPATTPETPPGRDPAPSYDMTFTCKKCDTRSTHRVSKQGYHHGTILITCPGCKNRHLIADHLKVCDVFLRFQGIWTWP